MTKINQHNNTRTVVMLSSSTLSAKDKGEEGDWKGRRFRKQIAAFGQLYSPLDGEECELLDEAWAEEMLANFEAKQSGKIPTLPRVSIPFDHWSGTKDNAGEVVALEIVPDDGVYATLEIRDYEALYRLEQDLVFDVSMCFNWHYIDTRTGDDRGIVLEHVALVNDPFITGMNAFEEAPEQLKRDEAEATLEEAEAYLNNFNRRTNAVVMFSKNKVEELAKMRKHFSKDTEGEEPEVVEVTNDRDFDVVITVKDDDGEDVSKTVKAGETVEVPADQAEAVKKQIADAKDPNENEGEGDDKENMSREGEQDEDKDGEDKADEGDGEADADEADKKGEGDDKESLSRSEREELSRLRAERNQAKAETAYQTMLSAGMIVPAQKDAFMQLHQNLSKAGGRVEFSRDGKKVELSTTELLEELVKAGGKRVQFNQTGSTNGEAADKDDNAAISKNLSQEEVEGLKANGISTKQIDELAAKSPAYAEAMARVKSNE